MPDDPSNEEIILVIRHVFKRYARLTVVIACVAVAGWYAVRDSDTYLSFFGLSGSSTVYEYQTARGDARIHWINTMCYERGCINDRDLHCGFDPPLYTPGADDKVQACFRDAVNDAKSWLPLTALSHLCGRRGLEMTDGGFGDSERCREDGGIFFSPVGLGYGSETKYNRVTLPGHFYLVQVLVDYETEAAIQNPSDILSEARRERFRVENQEFLEAQERVRAEREDSPIYKELEAWRQERDVRRQENEDNMTTDERNRRMLIEGEFQTLRVAMASKQQRRDILEIQGLAQDFVQNEVVDHQGNVISEVSDR